MNTPKPDGIQSEAQASRAQENVDAMTMRLKISIERGGQFNDALNDMAEGYAAGRGIQFFDAKNEIKDRFFTQMKMSPKEYLDQNYSKRPSYAKSHGAGQAMEKKPSFSTGHSR